MSLDILDDYEAEYLGVGHRRKDDDDYCHRVPRSAESVFLERKLNGDEPFEGHEQYQPAGHQVAHVLREVLDLAESVAERREQTRVRSGDGQ